MALRRLGLITIGVLLAYSQGFGCSWGYPVWPKSKESDTPLFRFVVNSRNSAGYIDRQGKIVIQPQYEGSNNHGGDFFEGLAKVGTKADDFYIDATGRRVADSDWRSEGKFSEGLATRWVRDTKKYGYIDRTGKLAIPGRFDSAAAFSEGLASVGVDGRIGFINHSGEFAIPARFARADDFTDGHAIVIENGPCEFIGHGPCAYSNPEIIGGGVRPRWSASIRPCKYSVIDRSGKVLFAGGYIDAKHFSEGLAPMGDGKSWGYVDYSGNVRISLQYDDAQPSLADWPECAVAANGASLTRMAQ